MTLNPAFVRHKGLNVFATASTFNDLRVKNFPASIKSLFFLSILNATRFSSNSDKDNFFQRVDKSSIKTSKVDKRNRYEPTQLEETKVDKNTN